MLVYRIARSKWIRSLTGSGVAGRWNKQGCSVLYGSCSLALALLEMLVHVKRDQVPDYWWRSAEVPDSMIEDHPSLEVGIVPPDSAEQGAEWLDTPSGYLALAVPSVIVPEPNILINPNHTDFIHIQWNAPEQLVIDPRLLRG